MPVVVASRHLDTIGSPLSHVPESGCRDFEEDTSSEGEYSLDRALANVFRRADIPPRIITKMKSRWHGACKKYQADHPVPSLPEKDSISSAGLRRNRHVLPRAAAIETATRLLHWAIHEVQSDIERERARIERERAGINELADLFAQFLITQGADAEQSVE